MRRQERASTVTQRRVAQSRSKQRGVAHHSTAEGKFAGQAEDNRARNAFARACPFPTDPKRSPQPLMNLGPPWRVRTPPALQDAPKGL